MLFFTLDIRTLDVCSNILILWKRVGHKIAKSEDVTHWLTEYVWLLSIKAAKRIPYVGSTDMDYIPPVCWHMGWIWKRKSQIIAKQNITKQNRPTDQPRNSRKLTRLSKRALELSYPFPLCVGFRQVLSGFLFTIFPQLPIQNTTGSRIQVLFFESG